MAEENGDMTFETIAYLEDSSYEQHAIISTNSKIHLSVGRSAHDQMALLASIPCLSHNTANQVYTPLRAKI